MKLMIDADACPVIDIAVRAANRYGVPAVLVCDHSHVFSREDVEVITVSQGADSADYRIVSMTEKGDIVVTQDYGLAALVLAKSGHPISQDGMIFCEDNIGPLLESRYMSAKIRRGGGRLKGMPKRTSKQDDTFLSALNGLFERLRNLSD